MGLVLGTIGGLVTANSGWEPLCGVAGFLQPIGELWTRLLYMTVIPLVLPRLVVAVMATRRRGEIGRLCTYAMGVHVGLFALGTALTLLLAPPLIERFEIDSETRQQIEAVSPSETPYSIDDPAQGSLVDWFVNLVPENVVRSAVSGALIPLMLFGALFGFAASSLPELQRMAIEKLFGALAEATMGIVEYVLLAMPIGVFCLAWAFVAETGWLLAGAVGYFVLLVSGLLLILTLLLYPIVGVLGRIPIRRFARAALSPQAVAISTRSSLASLPALMETSIDRLHLPKRVVSVVLPLAVSMLKINRSVSSLARLLFLVYVFDLTLSPRMMWLFILFAFIHSLASPGIPGGSGGSQSLPFYLAAGIPLEGFLLFRSADAIPDIFKTVANVTNDLGLAAITSARVTGAEHESSSSTGEGEVDRA